MFAHDKMNQANTTLFKLGSTRNQGNKIDRQSNSLQNSHSLTDWWICSFTVNALKKC